MIIVRENGKFTVPPTEIKYSVLKKYPPAPITMPTRISHGYDESGNRIEIGMARHGFVPKKRIVIRSAEIAAAKAPAITLKLK